MKQRLNNKCQWTDGPLLLEGVYLKLTHDEQFNIKQENEAYTVSY